MGEDISFKRILILEDDMNQQNILKSIVCDYFEAIEVHTASTYDEALHIIDLLYFDIFMLDISLGDSEEKDGVDFAKTIRVKQDYKYTPIIYITSVSDRLEEALNNTHCYAYIKKPFTKDDIINKIDDMLHVPREIPTLDIKGIGAFRFNISISDITFIEAEGHTISINTYHNRYETKSYTLKEIKKMLPDYFVYCHKSFLINTTQTITYDSVSAIIRIDGANKPIPVARKYKKDLREGIKP